MHVEGQAESVPEEYQLGQFIPLHYHYVMLQDEDRVGAFRAAIEQLVQPGMHVLELGGGTGILSSFAARQGARVTCVERNPALARSATKFLKLNDLHRQVEVFNEDAATFCPKQPVDVVICEMLHVAMLREKQLHVIDSFKRNYRETFGAAAKLPVFIPEASILMAQPVQQSFEFAGYWAPVPLFQAPRLHDERTTELGPLVPYSSISYEEDYPLQFDHSQEFPIHQSGSFNALRFITQNVLSIDVQNQSAITWPNQCLVLPIKEPTDVLKGQNCKITFKYSAGASLEQLAESLSVPTQGENVIGEMQRSQAA